MSKKINFLLIILSINLHVKSQSITSCSKVLGQTKYYIINNVYQDKLIIAKDDSTIQFKITDKTTFSCQFDNLGLCNLISIISLNADKVYWENKLNECLKIHDTEFSSWWQCDYIYYWTLKPLNTKNKIILVVSTSKPKSNY